MDSGDISVVQIIVVEHGLVRLLIFNQQLHDIIWLMVCCLYTRYLSMPTPTYQSDKSLFHSCAGILKLISDSLSSYGEKQMK